MKCYFALYFLRHFFRCFITTCFTNFKRWLLLFLSHLLLHQHPYAGIMGGHLIQTFHVTDQKIEAQRDKVIFQCQNRVLNLKFLGIFLFHISLPTPLCHHLSSSEGTVHLKASFLCSIDYQLCPMIRNSGPIFLCDVAVLRMVPFV